MTNSRFAVIALIATALSVCVAGIFAPPLLSQTTYGSLAGTVSDASGGRSRMPR